jgi:hypothetical protein
MLCRFWVPGPDGGFIQNLQYVRGFLQLQDMIDRAIIRVTEESSSNKRIKRQPLKTITNMDDIGVYTQQFPYPCFVRDK